MQIVNREELINALMDAAELEHNLACLYLFSTFSIKEDESELTNVPPSDRSDVIATLIEWKRRITEIAIQEIRHLATVSNLLTLVGAEAHFDRPNFPRLTSTIPPTRSSSRSGSGSAP